MTMQHTSSADELPHVKRDPTRPGALESRTRPLRQAEEAGGAIILWNAWLNHDTAFSQEERRALRLEGLLPPAHETLELQAGCRLKKPAARQSTIALALTVSLYAPLLLSAALPLCR
jgi:hypothetical protein